VPDGPETVEFGLTVPSQGLLRAGRNPYASLGYVCRIDNFDLTSVPSYNRLELQCLNPNTSRAAGDVEVRLHRKGRTTGQASEVVRLACPAGSPTLRVVSVPLGVKLNFRSYAYWATLHLRTTALPVEAHMVSLTTR
jgi:hypothetical protein